MEENQEKIEENRPQRDDKGRLIAGCDPINPSGENGLTGYAHVQAREDYFLDKFTAAEFKAIVTDPEKNMPLFTLRDWQIITHLARTIAGKDIGKERERMYDRRFGTPVQTTILKNPDGSLNGSTINVVGVAPVAAAEPKNNASPDPK